jgi:hypothetical protein
MQEAPAAPSQDERPPEGEQAPFSERSDPGTLLKYAETIHVGPGAEECEHRDAEHPMRDGAGCEEPEHYHLYLRLPNQFQHSDIREKALAAKARRRRQLEDEETDSGTVLQADMDAIRRLGEGTRESIVDELLTPDWLQDYQNAQQDVIEKHDEFAHIDQDRERWRKLDALEAEERPQEEYDELMKHLSRYEDLVDERRRELQGPRREALDARPFEELVGLLREHRIDSESRAAFMEMYSRWLWYIGTLKPTATDQPKERFFENEDELHNAPPPVILALTEEYRRLESNRVGPSGKGSS